MRATALIGIIILLVAPTYGKTDVYELGNSLTLAVEENPNSETVAIRVRMYGKLEQIGLCSLLGHLMEDDNELYSADEMTAIIEPTGGSFWAYGGNDYVTLYASVPAKDFSLALDILYNMLANPLLKNEDLQRERSFLLDEIVAEKDYPDSLLDNELNRVLFMDHPYKGKLIVDNLEEFKRITVEDIKDFHSRYLKGGNVHVVVVGNIKRDKVLELVSDSFGRIPEGIQKTEEYPVKPLTTEIRRRIKKRTTESQFCMAKKIQPLSPKEINILEVVNRILRGLGGRLGQEIREKRGYAYWVLVSGASSISKDGGYWAVYAGVKKKRFKEVEEIVLHQINRLIREPVSDEELSRAKKKLITGICMREHVNRSRAVYIHIRIIRNRPIESTENRIRNIESVSKEDIMALAKKLFSSDKYAILTLY